MLSVGEGGSTHRLAVVPVCSCLSVAQKEMSSHPQPRVLSWPPGPLMENISEHAFFYLTLGRMNSPTKQKESLLF